MMELIRRLRLQALFCAFAFLICELVSRPFADMGVADDWPYIVMAQKLATTGHVVYNGFATAMLGWQLYLAEAFIKLFGFSFTAVRMSTLLVGMVMAFVLQRTMVRAGISERNATIGTLAFVVSPLYLVSSATFMTDIPGLFAIVLCLYGCLRALQATRSGATIGWLCFAVVTNALCGTSRQISWLGVLVMVPCTLWLLRTQRRGLPEQRRVLLAGAVITLVGCVFIFGCMRWLSQQPYSVPEHLIPSSFPLIHAIDELLYVFLGFPFLLLPIVVLFFPEIRKCSPRMIAALILGYLLVTVHPRHVHHVLLLVPLSSEWVLYLPLLQGNAPIFLHTGVHLLLTIASLGGLICLIVSLARTFSARVAVVPSTGASWKQLGWLLVPFSIAYLLLLLPRAATSGIHDRYLLGLVVAALLCVVRYYQERIQLRLPFAAVVMVGLMAIYGIAVTHNAFAFYRARVDLAAELRHAGVPETSVDNGWEYNLGVELQHADFLNDPTIVVPAKVYVDRPQPTADTCPMTWFDRTPHITPVYTVSFDPYACDGAAPFAPVTYSRWLASSPGTLYVVRTTPFSKP